MSKYALSAVLILFGIRACFETFIPEWTVGVLAWAAAAVLISEAIKCDKTP